MRRVIIPSMDYTTCIAARLVYDDCERKLSMLMLEIDVLEYSSTRRELLLREELKRKVCELWAIRKEADDVLFGSSYMPWSSARVRPSYVPQ